MDEGAATRFKAAALHAGWKSKLGPTDPEHTKKSSGVEFLWKETVDLMPITPATHAYTDAELPGRLLSMQHETAEGPNYITNIYGSDGRCPGFDSSRQNK